MTIATGNFAELLWPGIREIWGNSYNDYEPLYSQIFTQMRSDKAFEKMQGVTGLPLAAVKEQGAAVTFLDPYQGFQKEYVHVTYALGAAVTREMYDDDQYNYINSLPRMLARSMRQTEETLHFNVLNNAFTATITGADGVSMANASHPLVGGGTFSNMPATASDLTQSAIEQAFTDIMNFVDDQSLKIRVMPKTLVIGTALWAVAEKIMGTDRAVGSADNDVNPVRGRMKILVSPYITDTDAWFVVTDAPNGLITMLRRDAEVERDNEFSTQNLQFLTTKRWSQSWTDPRCIYATAGA